MLAIATLVQDDPYLRLPASERIAARRDRKAKLFKRVAFNAAPSMTDPPKKVEPVVQPADQWIDRQKEIPIVKEPWFSMVDENEPERRPLIRDIQTAVALHYGISRLDIISGCRSAKVVLPRQVAVYISKKMTIRSLPEIGRQFGNRDHTTQIHSINKIERLMGEDCSFAAEVTQLIESLGAI